MSLSFVKNTVGFRYSGLEERLQLIQKHVKSVEIVAYEELGTESIKKLYFDRYRVIVGIDSEGNTLQKQEVPKYAK
ncbi:hydro-lyase, tartrate/fumarate family, beta subunit [Salmonella sp. NCTC 11881]|nr:hydro-lyase, tartrate/fumarate family, beta subunit [Salmonella sp. NCTC 11881]